MTLNGMTEAVRTLAVGDVYAMAYSGERSEKNRFTSLVSRLAGGTGFTLRTDSLRDVTFDNRIFHILCVTRMA